MSSKSCGGTIKKENDRENRTKKENQNEWKNGGHTVLLIIPTSIEAFRCSEKVPENSP